MDEVPDTYTRGSDQNPPQKKKCKKAKWLSEEALQIAENRSERQRRKDKIYSNEGKVSENNKER